MQIEDKGLKLHKHNTSKCVKNPSDVCSRTNIRYLYTDVEPHRKNVISTTAHNHGLLSGMTHSKYCIEIDLRMFAIYQWNN